MDGKFELIEATIDEVHTAMEAGEVSSEELVGRYLERIEAYDRTGPQLNSVVTINDDAVDRAAALDDEMETDGFVGPLHGIPVLLKDQAETAGLRTTFGSAAAGDYVPTDDATITEKIRDAGGIILAKTNLPDFACSFFTYSSAQGQTKNPYDLDRDPGGSSGGTGTSVAANLGMIGVGEDTGGSIRVPAANCNLFGIRVTPGLVSRAGLSPITPRQDTAGPMTRTVTDMVRFLDVLVGYDPADTWTGATVQTDVDSYTEYLNEDGLEGVRIGVLRDVFGADENPRAEPVNAAVETATETMAAAGAELVDPVSIPDLDAQLEETTIYSYHGKTYLNEFLAARDGIPYDSVSEIVDAGQYHEDLTLVEEIAEMAEEPTELLEYWRKPLLQESFRRDVLDTFAGHDLDAIVFPDVQVVPPTVDELGDRYTTATFPTNTPIAPQTACPAVSLPGELTEAGLPVGVELLGKPYDEPSLIEMAYAYEQATDTRTPPESAPPIE
jgi:Asp-tRNA(Asn)/Glu-tRNA(Gln) amidotransferase A subunit family amidase